ncbi:hypothetical protein ACOTHJ_14720 [Achromobacter xylosoxidans]
MANLYDFSIVVRHAEFDRGMTSVPYGDSKYVFAEKNVEMTLKDALAERQRMSDAESRPHAAFITMRYKDDRKAPGIDKHKAIYKEAQA